MITLMHVEETSTSHWSHTLGAAIYLLVVAALGCAVPFLIKNKVDESSNVIFFANALAGGALIGFGFMHLLPETLHALETVVIYPSKGAESGLNATWVITVGAFVMMAYLDFFGHMLGAGHTHTHDHHYSTVGSPEKIDEHKSESTSDVESQYIENFRESQNFSGSLMMIVLSIHSIFDGIVVGSNSTATSIWIAAAIISAHKFIAALAFTQQLVYKNVQKKLLIGLLVTFIISSPIGAFIGLATSSLSEIAGGVLNAISTGFVFYLAVEMIMSSFSMKRTIAVFHIGMLVLLIGVLIIFGLTLLELSKHDLFHDHGDHTHDHDHDHDH